VMNIPGMLLWKCSSNSGKPSWMFLEKQGPFDHRYTKTEKLDSFAIDFAFQGF